jgi:hypothetical protein
MAQSSGTCVENEHNYIRVTTLTVTDMNMIKLAVGNLFDCMCMIC